MSQVAGCAKEGMYQTSTFYAVYNRDRETTNRRIIMARKILAMNHEYTMSDDNHFIYITNNETGFEIKCFKHLTLNDIKRAEELSNK